MLKLLMNKKIKYNHRFPKVQNKIKNIRKDQRYDFTEGTK